MADIYFISLGCDKNRIDAEIMSRRLLDAGHRIVDAPDQADCAIVNTCGFIDSAKEQAIEHIFDMVREKESGRLKAIVVTGCMAQRFGEELAVEIPETDAVIGLAANGKIVEVVEQTLNGAKVTSFNSPEGLDIEGERVLSTPAHYAYLKIAEGCSHHCTYCAIPSIRGKYRSRSIEAILAEARALVADGVAELILIAQDTTAYGSDRTDGSSLAGLLEELCKIENLWKIRLLYAYPDRINNALVEVMAREEKIAKYLDIPMQHADTEILRKMGRKDSEESLLTLIERLRCAMPSIVLRSSFIAGFPGETEQQFETLIRFLSAAQLDRVGCFAYSAEEGTPAAKLPDAVDDDVKQARAARFMETQSAILLRKQDRRVNSTMEVICDGFDEEAEAFCCRGDADAPEIDTVVLLPVASDLIPGEIYTVRITGVSGVDLVAELV